MRKSTFELNYYKMLNNNEKRRFINVMFLMM